MIMVMQELPDSIAFEQQVKHRFINVYLQFGIAVCGFFLVTELITGSYQYVWLELGVIGMNSILFLVLRRFGNYRLVSLYTVISSFLILYLNRLLEMQIAQTVTASGYIMIFPALAFFLAGRTAGLAWVIAFGVLDTVTTAILGYQGGASKLFSVISLNITSYAISTFFIYMYQSTVDRNSVSIREKNIQLLNTNQTLLESMKKIEEGNLLLQEKIREMEKMNGFMVDRELRMAQLKHQVEEAQQKSSVENPVG
jgi:hypothetical protein